MYSIARLLHHLLLAYRQYVTGTSFLTRLKNPLTSMISTLIADRPPLTSVQNIMLGLHPTRVKTYSAWLRDTLCYRLFQNVKHTFIAEVAERAALVLCRSRLGLSINEWTSKRRHCLGFRRQLSDQSKTVFIGSHLTIAVAFATGIVVSPLVHRAIPNAHAAAAPLTPAVIDLAALKHADIPATPFPDLHSS